MKKLFLLKLFLLSTALILILSSSNVNAIIVNQATGTMTLSNVNGEITSNVNNPNNIFVSFRESYPSSGVGGGGGTAATEQNPTVSHTYVNGLEANKTYHSSTYSDNIFIMNVSFEINKNIDYEVELKISQIIDINREPVPEMSSNKVVINYGAIFYSGLLYDDFNWGEIVFQVSKDILKINGASPQELRLYRYYDGNWNELDTRLIKETDKRYIFKAKTPGFSYFAVAVPNKSLPEEGNSATNNQQETNNKVTGNTVNNKDENEKPTTTIDEKTTNNSKKRNNFFPILIVLIIGGILGAYVYISKQRDQKGLYSDEQGIILQQPLEKTKVKEEPFGTAKINDNLFKSPEEQLHNYVEDELRDGFSRNEIQKELLKSGWDKVTIAKILDEFKNSFLEKKQVHIPNEDYDNLKKFIERKLAKGYSKEVIKKNLLRVGWKEPIVNSVIYEVNNPIKKSSYSSEAEAKLDDFIRKSLHRGHTKKEIINKLTSVGWQKNLIDKVMKKY